MMSKVDYDMIASAIAGVGNGTQSRLSVVARIADAMARENPRFSKARFIKECELTDEELATYNMAGGNSSLL
jgi:hypothetical protein